MIAFREIAKPLLRWYRRYGRDLPWRRTRDPYHIMLSEIMLQQTQVDRVCGYYRAWLKRFPTLRALSRASNAQVLRQWSGLGYNRRALQLRDAARRLVADGIPASRDQWLNVRGIGPYTAAAIAAFSQHESVLPIDTNVRRVLGRVMLGKPFPDQRVDERLSAIIEPQLSTIRGAHDVPQAIFDLANAYCKKTPDCARCPLRTRCATAPRFLSGRLRIPKRVAQKGRENRHAGKPHPDRIYRGRIVKLVHSRGPIPLSKVGPAVDPDYKPKVDARWIFAMILRLENDGLIQRSGRMITERR